MPRRAVLAIPLMGFAALLNRGLAATIQRPVKRPLLEALDLLAKAGAFGSAYPSGTDFAALPNDVCDDLYEEAHYAKGSDGKPIISDELDKAVKAELLRMM